MVASERVVSLVLQPLIDLPVLLPEHDDLILGPDGSGHPDLRELRLTTWRLSGDLPIGEAFKRGCIYHLRSS